MQLPECYEDSTMTHFPLKHHQKSTNSIDDLKSATHKKKKKKHQPL